MDITKPAKIQQLSKMGRSAGTGARKSRKSDSESENKLKKGGQPAETNTIFKYFKKKRSATDAELDIAVTPSSSTGTELSSPSSAKVLTILGNSSVGAFVHTVDNEEEDDRAVNGNAEEMSIVSSGQSVIICSPSTATASDNNNDAAVVEVDRSRSPSPLPEGQYEVEQIMDYDHRSTGDLYLIKWKGYSHEDNTWEPIENLAECLDKLVEFYLARKNQSQQAEEAISPGEKRRKRALPVPPDPRPLQVVVDEFFHRADVAAPSTNELNDTYKRLLNGSIPSSQRWSEKKLRKRLADVANLKRDPQKWDELRSQLLFCKADAAGQDLKKVLKEWENVMNRITGGMPKIVTENTVDLSGPPTDFTYINDYLPEEGIVIPQDPPMGCTCPDDCAGNKSRCCPKQLGGHHRGFYTSSKKMQADPGTPIYECNKICKCSAACSNRVVQDGVKTLLDKKFTIFQTAHCGWGVKSPKVIKKGSFVCMYVGEIISDAEADRRGTTYDQEGSTYLFDLDFNQSDGDDCPYVVDAKRYGNIAHFFNHSCDPNLAVYGVWSDCLDINLPKLALFAVRDIPIDTELTFDYTRSQEHRAEAEPRDLPPIKTKECRCGSANCRQFLF